MSGDNAKLTPKQRRFVEEYLVDLNATQAAIRSGYSAKTAHSVGHENLRKPEISKALKDAQSKRSDRTEITQDRVLQELARIGFADIRKAVAWGSAPNGAIGDEGNPAMCPVEIKPSTEVDDETAAAISEVSLTAQGVKLKMHDKLSALEKIARHLGMLNGSGSEDTEAPPMVFNINVSDPVGKVRVTKPE
ncbi:Terminase small subunit [Phaeobacter inhibens]|uniref:terminase small subunit n=1 Tax=Phaeobacter inhibens TaxID=221822 RepID=UPI000C9C0A69|nr:terminase small subunit [Phaeobacter inhibens]AUR11200.1 Terminase small subunit [Phaeobacter inhibens]